MRSNLFIVFIIALIPQILRKPFWGLLAYLTFNILRPEMIRMQANFPYIIIVTTIIGIIINYAKTNFNLLKNRELFLISWIYFGIIISMIFSSYTVPFAGKFSVEILKLVVISAIIILLCDSNKKVQILEDLLLAIMCFLGVWGIEQGLRGNERLEGLGGSALGDSNGIAAMFVLFTPLAFNKLFKTNKKKEKIFGGIATLILVTLIIFTKSRGGFLGLVLCTFYYIYKSKNKKKIIIPLLICGIIGLSFINQEYIDRIKTISGNAETGQLDTSASSRFVFWELGMKLFKDNFVFGVGFMAYPEAKLKYEHEYMHLDLRIRETWFRQNDPFVTHSTYIQMLSEVGLFGSLPFFMLIILNFTSNRTLFKNIKINEKNESDIALLNSLEVGIVGFCTCIIFINAIFCIFLPIQIMLCSIIRRNLFTQNSTDFSKQNNL